MKWNETTTKELEINGQKIFVTLLEGISNNGEIIYKSKSIIGNDKEKQKISKQVEILKLKLTKLNNKLINM